MRKFINFKSNAYAKKGFSLLEMLIVVALMAILSAIVIVPNLKALQTVRNRTDIENAKLISLAFEQYFYDNNQFPDGTAESTTLSDITGNPLRTLHDKDYLDSVPEVQTTTGAGAGASGGASLNPVKEAWYVKSMDNDSGKIEIAFR